VILILILLDLLQHYSTTTWLTLWNICVTNDHGYVPLVVNTSRCFPRSWLITGSVTRLRRQVWLVKQELLTLPNHLSSPPVFSGIRVTRSLVLYVCFVYRYLSFCAFSFGHCVPFQNTDSDWYLQTLLPKGFNMPSALIQRVLVIFVIDECI
jgi:hypothetical protein